MIEIKHIESGASSELISKVTASDVTYMIYSERQEHNPSLTQSRVYLGGKILFSKISDFSHLTASESFEEEIDKFIMQTHKTVVAQFISQLKKCQKNKTEYLREAQRLIHLGRSEEAFGLLEDGLEVYPDDRLLQSYCGSLYSLVGKTPEQGIKICRDAIHSLKGMNSARNDFLKPVFYLNLGRAYLGAGRKKEAVHALKSGLKEDPTNKSILSEIMKLGRRRRPVLPFLERKNALNKYLGLFLDRTGLSRRAPDF